MLDEKVGIQRTIVVKIVTAARGTGGEFHTLVTELDDRPKNMSYSFMEEAEGYQPDPFNPHNVVGMMDQTLANDYWFDQFTEPRIVSAMVEAGVGA